VACFWQLLVPWLPSKKEEEKKNALALVLNEGNTFDLA
jgi:hypothetical protein